MGAYVCACVSCAYLNEFYINTEPNLEQQKAGENIANTAPIKSFFMIPSTSMDFPNKSKQGGD